MCSLGWLMQPTVRHTEPRIDYLSGSTAPDTAPVKEALHTPLVSLELELAIRLPHLVARFGDCRILAT